MNKKLLIILAGLSCILTACSGTASGTMQPSKLGGYDAQIEYYSVGIKQKVEIADLSQRKVDDLLQAHATIRNKTNKEQTLEYKFRFFDRDGFEVGAENRPWTPLAIHAKDTASVQATAPNNKASYFKIIVSN